MTQLDLLMSEPVRSKKRGSVPASSRATYQAEHARIGKRADTVRDFVVFREACGDTPITAAELADWIKPTAKAHAAEFAQLALWVRRAFSDLQARGVVEKAGDRPCRVSGRVCATWRIKTR